MDTGLWILREKRLEMNHALDACTPHFWINRLECYTRKHGGIFGRYKNETSIFLIQIPLRYFFLSFPLVVFSFMLLEPLKDRYVTREVVVCWRWLKCLDNIHLDEVWVLFSNMHWCKWNITAEEDEERSSSGQSWNSAPAACYFPFHISSFFSIFFFTACVIDERSRQEVGMLGEQRIGNQHGSS